MPRNWSGSGPVDGEGDGGRRGGRAEQIQRQTPHHTRGGGRRRIRCRERERETADRQTHSQVYFSGSLVTTVSDKFYRYMR